MVFGCAFASDLELIKTPKPRIERQLKVKNIKNKTVKLVTKSVLDIAKYSNAMSPPVAKQSTPLIIGSGSGSLYSQKVLFDSKILALPEIPQYIEEVKGSHCNPDG